MVWRINALWTFAGSLFSYGLFALSPTSARAVLPVPKLVMVFNFQLEKLIMAIILLRKAIGIRICALREVEMNDYISSTITD
jgi:hypothetical protein